MIYHLKEINVASLCCSHDAMHELKTIVSFSSTEHTQDDLVINKVLNHLCRLSMRYSIAKYFQYLRIS